MQSSLQALIAEVRQSDQSSDFAQRLNQRLKQSLGSDFALDVFLNGRDFASMRASLWQSYFANLIMETVRPFDRPAMVFWIRLFHLLDRIKKAEAIVGLVRQFGDIRQVIPLLVAGQKPRRASLADKGGMTADATTAANAAIAADARHMIDKLRDINVRLQERLGEKIAISAQSESVIIDEAETGAQSPHGRESDPWRFRPAIYPPKISSYS
ncbi:hypothetical protein [Nitrosomonas communis]|uniref:Uncharacterized protein n=1 Tax=Nitrosomonas communis TaxID=44574 RepID=A0A1I4U148_9PROT|nr:hypothetical protein [Nitrosomonas communis]SFM82433.1 hypothetical protein SAMN05421863_105716 [Nitrosomonas communis]